MPYNLLRCCHNRRRIFAFRLNPFLTSKLKKLTRKPHHKDRSKSPLLLEFLQSSVIGDFSSVETIFVASNSICCGICSTYCVTALVTFFNMIDASKVTSLLKIIFFVSRHQSRYSFISQVIPMNRAFLAFGFNFYSFT